MSMTPVVTLILSRLLETAEMYDNGLWSYAAVCNAGVSSVANAILSV
jgi:hypothetical protein